MQTDPTPDPAPNSPAEPTQWTPDLMLALPRVGAVRPSPDGTRVAYVVTEPVRTPEKSEFVAQIWLADADGKATYPVTFGETSSENPRWSPDGSWLAFTSKRGEKTNLYRLRLAGGEAEPLLSALKSDVGEFQWAPDSARIAFLMTDAKTEDEEKDEKAKTDWRWADEAIKYSRLYVVVVEKNVDGKREPRLLTAENYQVNSPFDWSPDGSEIVFAHQFAPLAEYWTTSSLSVVAVETAVVRPLVHDEAAAAAPFYSPDGTQIAFTRSDTPPHWAFAATVQTVSASGGEPHLVGETFDAQPNLLGWSADGQRIYFSENRGTKPILSVLHIGDGHITPLSDRAACYQDFALNSRRTHFGFRAETTESLAEAFVSVADAFAPARVSAVHAGKSLLPLGKTEAIRWKSADGTEIEGLLTYPVGYTPGERVPLLLEVHGGPTGVFIETCIAAPAIYPRAAFAAAGYAILRTNPRGSSGYGKDFRYANCRNWGGGDFADLMAGVDHVIALGVADAERLGVMGWSYGGYMTSWIVGHTNRFKAASIGAAVTDLTSFTGTADIPGFLPSYFGAQPWEDAPLYAAHSPLTHLGNAETPALIQHCEGDARVPIGQGYEIYNALKQRKVPVRMLVIPRQTHGPTEPKAYLKIAETNFEWFEERLKSGQ